MSKLNIPPLPRPDEELIRLMEAAVNRWWHDNEAQIVFLERLFNETCTMDQLGFIHDKATGKMIAGSKIEWFNRMLGVENI